MCHDDETSLSYTSPVLSSDIDDSDNTDILGQIQIEGWYGAKGLGYSGTTNKNISNQRYTIWELNDFGKVHGNHWPAFMFDSFEVTIRIGDEGLLVPLDPTGSASTLIPAEYYIELQNVELHMSYYDVSEDEVGNIRE